MNGQGQVGRRLAPAFLVVLFLAATLGPVLTGFDRFPEKSIDQDYHHVPVVLAFAEMLPAVDLSDYDSATTPGMHLVLAAAVRMFGPSVTMLQVCACGFGVLFVVIAYRYAAKVATPWTAFFCTIPLASSPYVLGNSIWVMTDNLSLALIAISIGSAIFCVASRGQAVGSGIALICSVLVRQINIWVSGIALLAFLFQWDPIRRRLPFRDPLQPGHRGLQAAVIFAIATVAAAGVIAGFVMLWGGLVPPKFQVGGDGVTHAGGLNHGVTPGVFSLFAVYASPLVVVLLPFWWHDRRVRRAMFIGLAVGLLAGLSLESVVGEEYGRNGGWLWLLAGWSPTILGRSSLIVAGSVAGGATAGILFGLLVASGRARTAWLVTGFAISFLAAYTVNSSAFQRYFDPPILLAIGWCLASLDSRRTAYGTIGRGQLRVAAFGVFSLQAVFAFLTLYAKMRWAES